MEDSSETRITLRLSTALRNKLMKWADANSRSMNGEMVFRLENYDRLSKELLETTELLEKREEALFEDRVKLRKMVPENQTLSDLVKTQKDEIADLKARLEKPIIVSPLLSDQQLKAVKRLAESLEWRESKLEIDIGHAIATLREVTDLLKGLLSSPEHFAQAVIAGRRVIESASTYLGRPFVYDQLKTSRFVDEAAPDNLLEEVIATAEWVTEQLLHEYRRLKKAHSTSALKDVDQGRG